MAAYTSINKEEVAILLQEQYGITNILTFKILSGGSENSNYLIRSTNRAVVVTICEQKTATSTRHLAQLLMYLNANGFATSQVISTLKGKLITSFKGKPILLKEFMAGTIEEDLSKKQLTKLGQQLAKLHQIPAPDYLPRQVAFGIERFKEVEGYAPLSTFNSWLTKTQAYIQFYLQEDLPKTLIHSDIFYNNIIIDPKEATATIMDFEEACYYYRLFDIGMMIVGTCCKNNHLNKEKTRQLVKGYQQRSFLSIKEKNALQAFTVYAATATAYWRHQNFNYVHIIPKMKNHYLAMQQLADHIRTMESQWWLGL